MKPMPKLGDVPFRATPVIKRKERLSINWGVVQGLVITVVVAVVFWGGVFMLVKRALQ